MTSHNLLLTSPHPAKQFVMALAITKPPCTKNAGFFGGVFESKRLPGSPQLMIVGHSVLLFRGHSPPLTHKTRSRMTERSGKQVSLLRNISKMSTAAILQQWQEGRKSAIMHFICLHNKNSKSSLLYMFDLMYIIYLPTVHWMFFFPQVSHSAIHVS